jgi:FkbM family methyltransferase
MIRIVLSQWTSLTRIKIWIARCLFLMIRPFVSSEKMVIERNGIRYAVDLSEGVDFSIFVFGSFQKHIIDAGAISSPSANIIDVGANIGHMTLEYSKKIPDGRIFCFEPTDYAFEKLQKNIALNPSLMNRIVAKKALVSAEKGAPKQLQLYSSWKLTLDIEEKHKVHGGSFNSTSMVDVISIDSFVQENQLSHLELIKIDTDGSEFEVLVGAKETLMKFRPAVVFEVGLYLLKEKSISFETYLKFFSELGYELKTPDRKKMVTSSNFKSNIPNLGTTDLLAIPVI